MSNTSRKITTPNRTRYMNTTNNLYYAPQSQKGAPKKPISIVFVGLIFLLVGLGLGYFTYPFISPVKEVAAEVVKPVVVTAESVLDSVKPADVVAYVNKHKDLFPSLVPAPTPKPQPVKVEAKPVAKPALVVLNDKDYVRAFRINYLKQYYQSTLSAVDFGTSKSGRVINLHTKEASAHTVLLTFSVPKVGAVDALLHDDGTVQWQAVDGLKQIDVERALQLIVDCVNGKYGTCYGE